MLGSTNNSTRTTDTLFVHRLSLAVVMSCFFSISLGLLFACVAFMPETHGLSVRALFLPGVLPVTLLGAGIATVVMIPVAFWSVRCGEANLRIYGSVLWIVLAAYIVIAIPRTGREGPVGLLALAVLGAVIIGFIPKTDSA